MRGGDYGARLNGEKLAEMTYTRQVRAALRCACCAALRYACCAVLRCTALRSLRCCLESWERAGSAAVDSAGFQVGTRKIGKSGEPVVGHVQRAGLARRRAASCRPPAAPPFPCAAWPRRPPMHKDVNPCDDRIISMP